MKGLADRYAPYSDFGQALLPVKTGKGVFIESRKYLEYLINTQFTNRGSSSMRIIKVSRGVLRGIENQGIVSENDNPDAFHCELKLTFFFVLRARQECFAPYSVAVALQLHSPLKGQLNLVLSRLVESGLVRQWFLETLRRTKLVRKNKLWSTGTDLGNFGSLFWRANVIA